MRRVEAEWANMGVLQEPDVSNDWMKFKRLFETSCGPKRGGFVIFRECRRASA
jgi:hypothetical protein